MTLSIHAGSRAMSPKSTYHQLSKTIGVQFMDIHNLDLRALKKSCIHFAQPDGKLIPLESYNLFYRGKRMEQTNFIRAEIKKMWRREREGGMKKRFSLLAIIFLLTLNRPLPHSSYAPSKVSEYTVALKNKAEAERAVRSAAQPDCRCQYKMII